MKFILIALLSFVGVTAALSGILMMINPDGTVLHLPSNLLKGSPFKDYFIPGILLAFMVGGVNLLALWRLFQGHRNQYNWAIAAGGITIAWIGTQVMMIHVVNWLHVLYFAFGVLSILLAYQLKGKWAA